MAEIVGKKHYCGNELKRELKGQKLEDIAVCSCGQLYQWVIQEKTDEPKWYQYDGAFDPVKAPEPEPEPESESTEESGETTDG